MVDYLDWDSLKKGYAAQHKHCFPVVFLYIAIVETEARVLVLTAGPEDEEPGRRVSQKYTSPHIPTTKENRRSLKVYLGISHTKALYWKGLGWGK